MTQSDNPYIVHVYSRLPAFAATNDLPEERVIEEVAALQKAWDLETRSLASRSDEERRHYFESNLGDKKGVLVLVRDTIVDKVVAFGELVERTEREGLMSMAYVSRPYRESGIYEDLIKNRTDAAVKIGYERVIAEPASDSKARRVLERNGFALAEREGSDVILRKDLGPTISKEQGPKRIGGPEGPGTPKRMRKEM